MVPSLQSNHRDLEQAFRIAVGDLYSNIIPFQSGLLDSPQPTIMAGLEYDSPWTRDAAINCWNAGSLFVAAEATNTLMGVLSVGENGAEIAGQYWDRIIWITGAWHHYLVTGDREFLSLAATVGANSLRFHEESEFDPVSGLFRGAACFQDGVAGYPDRYARTNGSSNILDWIPENPDERAQNGAGLPIVACSTNCLYYAAYRDFALILDALDREGAEVYRKKSEKLRRAIARNFWDPQGEELLYLIEQGEPCFHQEGFGAAFALLFNLLSDEQSEKVLENHFITAHGIPCVWPSFSRYETADGMGFGRHSGTIWPQVQGFWAEACARRGRPQMLMHELLSLTKKACRDAQFTEIYHPITGAIYGGRQEQSPEGTIVEWESCRRQTWSATAFLRMILHGLLGLRFEENGLRFEPLLAAPVERIRVEGIRYRSAILSIAAEGEGSRVKSIHMNGATTGDAWIAATLSGDVRIEMVLG